MKREMSETLKLITKLRIKQKTVFSPLNPHPYFHATLKPSLYCILNAPFSLPFVVYSYQIGKLRHRPKGENFPSAILRWLMVMVNYAETFPEGE